MITQRDVMIVEEQRKDQLREAELYRLLATNTKKGTPIKFNLQRFLIRVGESLQAKIAEAGNTDSAEIPGPENLAPGHR
jgi:hypothetical protein